MRNYTKFPAILLLQFILIQSYGQQFEWANSYTVDNSNEVAALTADIAGNSYIAGVFGASQFLPYTGNCYLLKTNHQGVVIWTKYFSGLVQIGDIVASGNQLLIVGQANGVFSYDGTTMGLPTYHMFLMKLDSSGALLWIRTDETRNGSGSNMVAGENGKVALNFKGVSNIGNYIEIVDSAGVVLQSKQITGNYAGIVDIAYFDDRVYLNGALNGPDSLVVDDIVIHRPDIENAAFILALNSDFIAEWAAVDTTINNRDGRILAGEDGVYAYFSALEPPFTIVNVLKKFAFNGQMLIEAEIPFFSTGPTLYPDMAIIPGIVGLYVNNDFDFNNHEVILFDEYLNLIGEMEVQGPSDLYSGQIAGSNGGFLVSHVHSGDLNFNNEISLSYAGPGKRPYISRLSLSEPTGVFRVDSGKSEAFFYPNPADHFIYMILPGLNDGKAGLKIHDSSGKSVLESIVQSGESGVDVSHLSAGVYMITLQMPDHQIIRNKLLIK